MHKTEVSDELRCFFFILEKELLREFKVSIQGSSDEEIKQSALFLLGVLFEDLKLSSSDGWLVVMGENIRDHYDNPATADQSELWASTNWHGLR